MTYSGFASLERNVALDEFPVEPFALDDLVADRICNGERRMRRVDK
jgi:hypothetical protein